MDCIMWYLPWSQSIKRQYNIFLFYARWLTVSLLCHGFFFLLVTLIGWCIDRPLKLSITKMQQYDNVIGVRLVPFRGAMKEKKMLKTGSKKMGGNVVAVAPKNGVSTVINAPMPSIVSQHVPVSTASVVMGDKSKKKNKKTPKNNQLVTSQKDLQKEVASDHCIKKQDKTVTVNPVKKEPADKQTVPSPVVNHPVVQERYTAVAPSDEAPSEETTDDERGAHLLIDVSGEQNTLNEKEYEMHAALLNCWHPPVGVSPLHSCVVRMTFDAQLAMTSLVIEQSSGVLLYDVSVKTALRSMVFPVWVRNKTIIIEFK